MTPKDRKARGEAFAEMVTSTMKIALSPLVDRIASLERAAAVDRIATLERRVLELEAQAASRVPAHER